MSAINLAAALCRGFEGFEETPYLCPGGYWTIGYGRNIHAEIDRWRGRTITRAEAESMLLGDLQRAADGVQGMVKVPLHDWERAALISFVFNLGAGQLGRSTLLKKVNAREYAAAPAELRRWIYAGGKVARGLQRRRDAEAHLFAAGSILREQGA